MALNHKKVTNLVSKYANDVRREFSVHKVYLYGSYAKGTASELSDIDVCFFIYDLEEDKWFDAMVNLRRIARKYIGIWFSPIVFDVSDLYMNNPFVNEVISTGIEIHKKSS
jgi:predicted nucleotidyltransferase